MTRAPLPLEPTLPLQTEVQVADPLIASDAPELNASANTAESDAYGTDTSEEASGSSTGVPYGAPDAEDRRHLFPNVGRPPKRAWTKVIDYAFLVMVAVILASLIRSFVGLAFYIPSESMYPTLKINDRVIVSRISYRFGDPDRGDVVVFRNPGYVDTEHPNVFERVGRVLFEIAGSRQPKDKNYIKRVIGLPGDKMMFKDGSVYINGEKLDETWLEPGVTTSFPDHENQIITVPKDHYFMMGDNRGDSCDSRCFGPPGSEKPVFIERSAIVGRAFHRIWPFNRFGSL
jgi:signal peptidase I